MLVDSDEVKHILRIFLVLLFSQSRSVFQKEILELYKMMIKSADWQAALICQ